MNNSTIFVTSIIIILIGIIPINAQILNSLQANRFYSQEGKITINENNSQIIELPYTNTHERQQDESQREIIGGYIMIELNIESPYEYKALLRNKLQNILPKQFNNINGYHYIKVNITLINDLEIVLERIIVEDNFDQENFQDDSKDDDQNEDDQHDQEELYEIKIISLEQNYCPFNCHGKGICESNGECLCNNGYDQESNCLIKIDRYTTFSDKVIKINSQNHQQNGWQYAGIYLGNLELFKKNTDFNIFDNQEINIVFKFYYENKSQESSHIFILDHHNYFKCLQTQQHVGGDSYQATFTFSSADFEKIFHNHYLYGYSIIFGWDNNAKNFSVQIQIDNDKNDAFQRSLQFLICILFSFAIFIILFISFVQKDNQTQQLLIVSQDKKDVHLSNNISKLIMKQMQIFEYQKTMNDSENSTYQQCSICLNHYENQDQLCKTQCDHVFHKQCLELWLSKHQVCPQQWWVKIIEIDQSKRLIDFQFIFIYFKYDIQQMNLPLFLVLEQDQIMRSNQELINNFNYQKIKEHIKMSKTIILQTITKQ